MTRSARATFLMLTLLWQSLVWLTPWGQVQVSADISNAWVHAQATAKQADHHHHSDHQGDSLSEHLNEHQSDPALHLDDHSTDGAHHHHEATQPLGLAPKGEDLGFDRHPSTRFSGHAAEIATVFLQGPLRPPQPPAV